jgi:hypothetical protein
MPSSYHKTVGKIYYTDVIYVCRHPTINTEIVKLPAGGKDYSPMAITGATFELCKERVQKVAEIRVKRLEAELEAAQLQLSKILSLKESDVKCDS